MFCYCIISVYLLITGFLQDFLGTLVPTGARKLKLWELSIPSLQTETSSSSAPSGWIPIIRDTAEASALLSKLLGVSDLYFITPFTLLWCCVPSANTQIATGCGQKCDWHQQHTLIPG